MQYMLYMYKRINLTTTTTKQYFPQDLEHMHYPLSHLPEVHPYRLVLAVPLAQGLPVEGRRGYIICKVYVLDRKNPYANTSDANPVLLPDTG